MSSWFERCFFFCLWRCGDLGRQARSPDRSKRERNPIRCAGPAASGFPYADELIAAAADIAARLF